MSLAVSHQELDNSNDKTVCLDTTSAKWTRARRSSIIILSIEPIVFVPKNVNIKTPARDWSAHSSLIRKRYNVLRSPHPAEITTPCHSYLPQFGQFANKLPAHHTTRTHKTQLSKHIRKKRLYNFFALQIMPILGVVTVWQNWNNKKRENNPKMSDFMTQNDDRYKKIYYYYTHS